MKIIGIYKITSPSGRVYIGQSTDLKRREYLYSIYRCKYQIRLYASLKKYGWENHIFEIIDKCEFEMLNIRERYWQEYYDVLDQDKGLNCVLTCTKEKKKVLSEESKRKISETLKNGASSRIGNHSPKSEETKRKLSESRIGRFKGSENPMSRKVIDIVTKQIYNCVREAAEPIGIERRSLHDKLQGKSKNNTNLRFLNEYVTNSGQERY